MALFTDITSLEQLRRTTEFLIKASLVGILLAAAASFFLLDSSESILSTARLRILAYPVLFTSFAGALFIFPVGWFKTVKWLLLMAREVKPAMPASSYLYNRFNALFIPNVLTAKGLESRGNLIEGLKWIGVGAVLIFIAVTLGNWL